MSQLVTPRQIARTAALGFVALAITHSWRGEDVSMVAPLEREQADALATELVRCRTVTSDDAVSLESCRRVWTEKRRQFFRPTKTPTAPAEPFPAAAPGLGKVQDRASPAEAEHRQREVE
jgi:conjugative transfer region protein TrbK